MNRPVTLQDALSLAERMSADPALAVNLAGSLRDTIRRLPPPSEILQSRPEFQRCAKWTYGTTFFDIDPGDEAPAQEIRLPHRAWIRGVVAQAYFQVVQAQYNADALEQRLQLFRAICATSGTNGRGLFEVNWRLNGKQGFTSRGARGEILSPGALAAGDGFYYAPLDWQLEREDTIEIRIRSRMNELFPPAFFGAVAGNDVLRWVAVCFWAEELPEGR